MKKVFLLITPVKNTVFLCNQRSSSWHVLKSPRTLTVRTLKSPSANDTHIYVDEYGAYLKELNRGGLAFPGDSVRQWVSYSYIMFYEINGSCNALMMIIDKKQHGRILSNILLNNHCHLYFPRSSKEPKLKLLKLSNF